jgi:hypothetical protein
MFSASRYISGDSLSSLLNIWPLYIHGAEPATVAPLVLKFDIHLRQAGTKGVRWGEEKEWSGGGGRKLQ